MLSLVSFLFVLYASTAYLFICCFFFFFCTQKTAYELRFSDWSSDVCSSDLMAVHYRGSSPAMSDLLGGQVDLMFETMPLALAQTRANAVRAIAVTSQERSPALPDLPTLNETVAPGFAVSSWYGVMAPAAVPQLILQRMHQAIEQALATPDIVQTWESAGVQPQPMSQAEFQAFWQS